MSITFVDRCKEAQTEAKDTRNHYCSIKHQSLDAPPRYLQYYEAATMVLLRCTFVLYVDGTTPSGRRVRSVLVSLPWRAATCGFVVGVYASPHRRFHSRRTVLYGIVMQRVSGPSDPRR